MLAISRSIELLLFPFNLRVQWNYFIWMSSKLNETVHRSQPCTTDWFPIHNILTKVSNALYCMLPSDSSLIYVFWKSTVSSTNSVRILILGPVYLCHFHSRVARVHSAKLSLLLNRRSSAYPKREDNSVGGPPLLQHRWGWRTNWQPNRKLMCRKQTQSWIYTRR